MRRASLVSASKFLAEARDDAARARRRVAALRGPVMATACSYLNYIVTHGTKGFAVDRTVYTNFYVRYDDVVEITAFVDASRLLELGDERVNKFEELLQREGFVPTGDAEKFANQYSAGSGRLWRKPVGNVVFEVKVERRLDVDNEEAFCRRVQIGTEIKEVPKFAIVC